MSARGATALEQMAYFIGGSTAPQEARARAATAVIDTIGVAIAGSVEPAALIVQRTLGLSDPRTLGPSDLRTPGPSDPRTLGPSDLRTPGPSDLRTPGPSDPRTLGPSDLLPLRPCRVWGTSVSASAADAALANGTAAHALDYDDMCFVSLAHPSAPLVPAIVSAAELVGASGRALLDAYVVGFEIQSRLGRLMNPRHYKRGWHCTSTLGVMSAAAAASRLLGLDRAGAAHAVAIAASSASGLKENFGTMVKPLHAGLAARDGLVAALLAKNGMTASEQALEGPQGYLHALDAESEELTAAIADLGTRWEILDTGITVKLYPSCAGTHPTLDALLDLRHSQGFTAGDVERIDVDVDPIVPTILIYDRPASALEAKFSLQFCASAAAVFGRVGVDTFDEAVLRDPRVSEVMPRVSMRVDEAIGRGRPPLTEARVHVKLRDGRELTQEAHGARGYPERPASQSRLDEKFLACARVALSAEAASTLLSRLKSIDTEQPIAALLSAQIADG